MRVKPRRIIALSDRGIAEPPWFEGLIASDRFRPGAAHESSLALSTISAPFFAKPAKKCWPISRWRSDRPPAVGHKARRGHKSIGARLSAVPAPSRRQHLSESVPRRNAGSRAGPRRDLQRRAG